MRKSERKENNSLMTIIIILMLIIFIGTIYFILDVFGIIKVPNKYSIASLFYSQIETTAANGTDLPENQIITEEIKNKVFETREENTGTNQENVQNPMLELEQLQNNNSDNVSIENYETEGFYYSQLDDIGKTIYNKIYKNKEKLKTGDYTADFGTEFDDILHEENGKQKLNQSFQSAMTALVFDNPDLFYIDITKMSLITEITTRVFSTTYRVSVGVKEGNYYAEGFENLTMVNQSIEEIERISNQVIDAAGEDKMEQIKLVHDYLVDSMEYDGEGKSDVYTIYGALVNKKAVCKGYAKAYQYILNKLGIPCIVVSGVGENSNGEIEKHAWNYVLIDENWYAVDVTWDDPIITGTGKIPDNIKHKYYLKGSDEFFKDHYEDKATVEFNFYYPEISQNNYYSE